jgi:hypothetical protein
MYASMMPQNSGLAMASLMLEDVDWPLVEVCLIVLLVILAIIVRHVLLSRSKQTSGAAIGRNWYVDGTLIGVLIVVPVLMAIVTPTPPMKFKKSPMFETLVRGKQIFCSVTSFGGWPIEDDGFGFWPKSKVALSSTAFITNVVDRRAINVAYSYFSAYGVAPYRGTDATLFKAENNAWCVVADIHDETSDKIPYLFTRNLRISSLAELKGKVGDQLSDEPPFGRKGVPVIFKGGVAKILKPDMLWSNVLGGATFTNRVLRP